MTSSATSTGTSSIVTVVPGSGPVAISFGVSGSTASTIMEFDSLAPTIFNVSEQACSGNVFQFFDFDVPIGFANFTCPTPAAGGRITTSAVEIVSFSLLPGRHELKTFVVSSVSGGVFLASVDVSPAAFCASSSNGLFVTKDSYSFKDGIQMCLQAKMRPANINIFNFDQATQLAFNCSGPFSATYLASYWQNTYNNTCLALYTGVSTPGAAISVPASCATAFPFLCQVGPTFT